MTNLTLSQRVAESGVNLKYENIPQYVIDNSKKFILDVIGNILAAKHLPSSVRIVELAKDLGGVPNSSIIGFRYKTSPQMAALANATLGHGFDMDDDHREGTQHSTVVVFPAIYALAQTNQCSGKDFLTAFIYGSEVTIRLGMSLVGESYYQGFHATGTCGVFGAAGGCAKLLGLNAKQTAYAFGIAGSQSSGLLEWKAQGTWTKRFQAGNAAMGGVISALLGAKDYTSPSTIWEGEDGFVRAFSYKDRYDLSKITNNFGEKWEMADTSIKVHACCRFSAPLADCGIDLYNKGIDVDQVESVQAKVGKFTLKVLCNPPETKYEPQTVVDAQFSLPYAVALGMIKGKATVEDFTPDAIRDPEVIKLARKVTGVLCPEAEAVYPKYYPCTLVVKMKDGSEVVSHIDYPKGDPENPVSWEENLDKFRFMASHHIGHMQMDRIIDLVSNLEELDNLEALSALLE